MFINLSIVCFRLYCTMYVVQFLIYVGLLFLLYLTDIGLCCNCYCSISDTACKILINFLFVTLVFCGCLMMKNIYTKDIVIAPHVFTVHYNHVHIKLVPIYEQRTRSSTVEDSQNMQITGISCRQNKCYTLCRSSQYIHVPFSKHQATK